MAVYKIFPSQDTTLYSQYPNMNIGIDEIIEATTTAFGAYDPNPQASRFLIQFDTNEIRDIINNKISGSSWTSYLRCYAATITGLSEATTVYIYPLSQSWNNGTGKYLDQPITTNGASWVWADYSGSTPWVSTFASGSTGSYGTATAGGGVWYINPSASQLYEYSNPLDLEVDVKNIVSQWYTGSIANNGFIVKQANNDEFVDSLDVQVELKFFSIDTNTIYPPQLEFRWNDFKFSPGSLTELNALPATVALNQNPGVFYSESVNRFRVNSRPEYPPQIWVTSSINTYNYYLPAASYWAIKDLDTNEYIVDFDTTYTKLSVDASGSYFDVYMNGLEPERYYEILIQTTIKGSTIVFANNYYFKVING